MLSTFGFWEIAVVAVLGFAAFQIYQQERKFSGKLIAVIGAMVYLLYAGVFNHPETNYGL